MNLNVIIALSSSQTLLFKTFWCKTTIIPPSLKTMEKLLTLLFQPALKEHIGPYQLTYRCKTSPLDDAVVPHHNIVFSLEKGKM